MSKEKFLNILDLGNSKIRFTVFNEKYEKSFSENILVNYENDYSNHFHEINKIIKQAEKKISSHIENIVLITDSKNSFSIDLSFSSEELKEELKIIEKENHVHHIYHNHFSHLDNPETEKQHADLEEIVKSYNRFIKY